MAWSMEVAPGRLWWRMSATTICSPSCCDTEDVYKEKVCGCKPGEAATIYYRAKKGAAKQRRPAMGDI